MPIRGCYAASDPDIGPFQNAKLSRYDAVSSALFGGDMRRRDFIAAMGAAAGCLSAPLAVRAQQTTTRTIGWLSLRSADTSTEKNILAAFRQGLNQTGYVEGRNLTIEFRFADGHYDRLPALAADLVRRQVEVLMTGGGTNVARAAQAATTTIPIIFVNANDPVQEGIVKQHQPAEW